MRENDPDTHISASQHVLDKIRAHQLTMRPKLHFTLTSVALIAVAFLTLLLSVALGSFILFNIRASYATTLLGFGPSGYIIFFQLFPWPLLVLDIASIVLLEWMLRKFRFGYRSPLLYLLLAIFVVALTLTTVLERGHLSDQILRGARSYGVPFMGDFYDQGRRPLSSGSGACPCTVIAIDGSTLTMEERMPHEQPRQILVVLPDAQATSSIHIGDRLFVFGEMKEGVLHAFGIRPMDADVDDDSPAPISNTSPAGK